MIEIAFEVADEPPRLIVTERMPYALATVWLAQTEALYVQQWWAPIGYRNVDITLAVDVGDTWRVVQQDPQGNRFAFYGKVTAFEPQQRLQLTLTSEIFPDTQLTVEQVFSSKDRVTEVVSTYTFEDDVTRDSYLNLGGIERLRGASRKLDALLAQMAP